MDDKQLEKLERLCNGVDFHLKKITEETIPLLITIKSLLVEIKSSIHVDNKQEMKHFLEKMEFLLADPNPEKRSFLYLKDKLENDEWPYAVNPDEIAVTDKEKEIRADLILDNLIGTSLENKKFLYYGGDDYIRKAAIKQNCKIAVDSVNLGINQTSAPYDHILVYNYIDKLEDPVQFLINLKELMHKDSVLTLRVHPWCSRHGIDQYNQLNKAYLHLIFNEQELTQLGVFHPKIIKITDPEKEYDEIISMAGFYHITKTCITKKVEKFFTDNVVVKNRIKEKFEKLGKEYIPYKLSVEFLDYTLKKNS